MRALAVSTHSSNYLWARHVSSSARAAGSADLWSVELSPSQLRRCEGRTAAGRARATTCDCVGRITVGEKERRRREDAKAYNSLVSLRRLWKERQTSGGNCGGADERFKACGQLAMAEKERRIGRRGRRGKRTDGRGKAARKDALDGGVEALVEVRSECVRSGLVL